LDKMNWLTDAGESLGATLLSAMTRQNRDQRAQLAGSSAPLMCSQTTAAKCPCRRRALRKT
jgi:hypothetical protein